MTEQSHEAETVRQGIERGWHQEYLRNWRIEPLSSRPDLAEKAEVVGVYWSPDGRKSRLEDINEATLMVMRAAFQKTTELLDKAAGETKEPTVENVRRFVAQHGRTWFIQRLGVEDGRFEFLREVGQVLGAPADYLHFVDTGVSIPYQPHFPHHHGAHDLVVTPESCTVYIDEKPIEWKARVVEQRELFPTPGGSGNIELSRCWLKNANEVTNVLGIRFAIEASGPCMRLRAPDRGAVHSSRDPGEEGRTGRLGASRGGTAGG